MIPSRMISGPAGLLLWAAALACTVLSAGCNGSNPAKPPVPERYLPQDSPANCLANLQTAYVDRDSIGYKALFSDDFTFVFSPNDVTNPINPTPAQWGLGGERTAHARMFGDTLVEMIELSFYQIAADSSEYPDTRKVDLNTVNLRIFTHREDGTPYEYRVPNGTAVFYFKEYPAETARNGRPLWRIWRWEDRPPGRNADHPRARPLVQEVTWGLVKYNFR